MIKVIITVILSVYLMISSTIKTSEIKFNYCNIPHYEIISIYKELPQDYDLICGVVMNEAGAESYKGICAVAQCIYNACERENKSFSKIRNTYGYYYTKTPSDTVKQAVRDVFCNGYRVTNEKIICYYNPNMVYSAWHESQKYVMTIDHHRFFAFNE